MMPNTSKKSTGLAVFFLITMFFLFQGPAWCASPKEPNPQNGSSGKVQIPSAKGPSVASSVKGTAALGNVRQSSSSNPCGTASSCPLALSTGPKGDIRDIRGPIHIPDSTRWIYYALGCAMLLLLAWIAWKWLRKKQAFRARTPFEIALAELEKAKALMAPEKAEQFSVMVSHTIRTYIEHRFNVRATRRTTREFMAMVAAGPSGELNHHSQSLNDFLVHCDLAKFARQMFSVQRMQNMLESARRFVEETKPKPEENPSRKGTDAQMGAAEQSASKNIKGKMNFFNGRIGNGFFWGIGGKAVNRGFRAGQPMAAAGGR